MDRRLTDGHPKRRAGNAALKAAGRLAVFCMVVVSFSPLCSADGGGADEIPMVERHATYQLSVPYVVDNVSYGMRLVPAWIDVTVRGPSELVVSKPNQTFEFELSARWEPPVAKLTLMSSQFYFLGRYQDGQFYESASNSIHLDGTKDDAVRSGWVTVHPTYWYAAGQPSPPSYAYLPDAYFFLELSGSIVFENGTSQRSEYGFTGLYGKFTTDLGPIIVHDAKKAEGSGGADWSRALIIAAAMAVMSIAFVIWLRRGRRGRKSMGNPDEQLLFGGPHKR